MTAAPTVEPTPAPPVAWQEISAAAGPSSREDHTWTVAEGGVAYLFGGRDGTVDFNDLWAYQLAADAWTQLSPAGPAPAARFGHEAVWVGGIGLVVFAGQSGADFFNDLWAYDPEADAWRELPSGGAVPIARYGTCAAVGPDGRLWISHGFTSELARFADTRAYDFDTGTWTDETPNGTVPVNRCLHACWWTDDGRLVLYGGQTTGATALGDLWSMMVGPRPGTNTWTEALGELPAERNLYAAARHPGGTFVFGGQSLEGGYLDDVWFLADGGGPAEVEVEGTPPPSRAGAEMVADPARDRFLVFGGRDADGAFADLWELTGIP